MSVRVKRRVTDWKSVRWIECKIGRVTVWKSVILKECKIVRVQNWKIVKTV